MRTLTLLAEEVRRLSAGGSALPGERQLAETLGVTRHQVRRAIAIVQAEGCLSEVRRPGRPARRRGEALVETTSPLEVIELRSILEPALAGLAALRASPNEIARIGRAAATPANQDTGAADLVFHAAIAEAAHNVLAADLYALLRQVGRDARLLVSRSQPLSETRLAARDREHAAIASAIAGRDSDDAKSAMRRHLRGVEQQVLHRLGGGEDDAGTELPATPAR